MVPVDRGIVQGLYKPSQWQVARDPAEHDRRSIYLIAKRNLRLPFLEVFDAPTLPTSCPRREVEHPRAAGARAAQRPAGQRPGLGVRRSAPARDRRRPEPDRRTAPTGWRWAGPPTPREEALALEFLRDGPLDEFTLALFNLNGFLYVP